MSFQIDCIEIFSNKKMNSDLLKGLKPGRFFFNDYYQKNSRAENLKKSDNYLDEKLLYGPNINVCAIVGMNGSGKSTLIDLVLLVINNFCYMFERGHKRSGADPLLYIPGLFATLYFRVEGEIRKIECKDKSVTLVFDGGSYSFEICEGKEPCPIVSNDEIIRIVEKLFYTIVSNYSLQSFIYSNYLSDCYMYDSLKCKDVLVKKNEFDETNVWINSIFHKNDGYVRSIVLNPYRDKGLIDISRELELSKDRVSALFIYSNEHKIDFFSPYTFKDLNFSVKDGFILQKFKKILSDYAVSTDIVGRYKTDDDVISILNDDFVGVVKEVFYLRKKNENRFDNLAFVYLQLKIYTIVNKYVGFESYSDTITLSNEPDNNVAFKVKEKEKLAYLMKLIRSDSSHVTKKIRRTINFLRSNISVELQQPKKCYSGRKYFRLLFSSYIDSVKRVLPKGFVLNKSYLENLSYNKEMDYLLLTMPFDGKSGLFISPVDVENAILPPFFKYNLLLYKDRYVVEYGMLSSGELQLIQTLSVHMYHIENILSIKNRKGLERPQYRNVNLIFDEIELCFHIEYQCSFVKRLLDMIKSMRQNQKQHGCSINIIIITHSPFILTDIPSRKTLYLQNGESIENKKETFAQNTFSLLHNNFLVPSFFGDFAKSMVFDLLNFLLNKHYKYDWNACDVDSFIELVGDELLRGELKKLKKRKYSV